MSSVVISGDTSGAITLASPAVAGTNTATLPAATGTVMVSGNMPAFSAYNTGGTGVTTNTFTKIILNNKEFDTNNNFDSTTNYRFTPTVAGYYQINGIAYLTASSVITSGYLAIYKNGSIYKQSGLGVVTVSVNSIFASISYLVYLNGSTDYVELYGLVVASSNPSIAAGSAYTSFSGSLARAA